MSDALYADRYRDALSNARTRLAAAVDAAEPRVVAVWQDQGRRMKTVADLLVERGCSTEELASVQATFGVPLPSSYRQFLAVMGAMPRHVDVGVNCFYPAVLDARDAFADWQQEMRELELAWYSDERFAVPERAVAIGHHEGYRFGFFADASDDPPMLMLTEGAEGGVVLEPLRFSQRVIQAIDQQRAFEVQRLQRAAVIDQASS